ncbi:MAG TPA: transporter substrate-binding protein [Acidimicrobiales bacterium]|nr:transporter substrate-binding protein [Acidimicrobiales bacterium]
MRRGQMSAKPSVPEGTVTIDDENQHISKTARIGRIGSDGLIKEIAGSDGPIEPDPFLTTYPWAQGRAG